MWRQGRHVLINIYDGDRPVCQCHNESDAALIVEAVNRMAEFKRIHDECHAQRDAALAELERCRQGRLTFPKSRSDAT